jgi:hypothetical protein
LTYIGELKTFRAMSRVEAMITNLFACN